MEFDADGQPSLVTDRRLITDAVLERLKPTKPFSFKDFGVPDLPGVIDVQPLVTQVCAIVETAIRKWAEQMKMEPENWLKFYEPRAQIGMKDSKLNVTVSARLRSEDPSAHHEMIELFFWTTQRTASQHHPKTPPPARRHGCALDSTPRPVP